jgi:hypothetical protein
MNEENKLTYVDPQVIFFCGPTSRSLENFFKKMNLDKELTDPQTELGCSKAKVAAAQAAIEQGLVSEDKPLAMLYNMSLFR